jgi:hypothetical protein
MEEGGGVAGVGGEEAKGNHNRDDDNNGTNGPGSGEGEEGTSIAV